MNDIIGIICIFFSSIYKSFMEFYFKEPLFWIAILLGITAPLFYPKLRGFFGEFWVRKELEKLPQDKYNVLNNIMIKSSKGTHQIDHIVISKFGIFVIEMKNYYGIIVGDEYKDKWIQYLGKNKYYFNNPTRQNYGHVKALEEVLRLEENKFIPVVCISNQAKLKIKAKNVTQLEFLNNLIESYKEEILDDNVNYIKEKLEGINITDKNARKNHVKNIRSNIKDNEAKEDNMICPKCGGTLVERNGKYGKFIGCSNYPKCRHIVKKNNN